MAIDNGYLTPYYYYPAVVTFLMMTKEISITYFENRKCYEELQRGIHLKTRELLIERARIIAEQETS